MDAGIMRDEIKRRLVVGISIAFAVVCAAALIGLPFILAKLEGVLSPRPNVTSALPHSTNPAQTQGRPGKAPDASQVLLPNLPPGFPIAITDHLHAGDFSGLALTTGARDEGLLLAASEALKEKGTFESTDTAQVFLKRIPPSSQETPFVAQFMERYGRPIVIIERYKRPDSSMDTTEYLSAMNSNRSSFVVSISDDRGNPQDDLYHAGTAAIEAMRKQPDEAGLTDVGLFYAQLRKSGVKSPIAARVVDPYGRFLGTMRYCPAGTGTSVCHMFAMNADGSIIAFSTTDSNGELDGEIAGAGLAALERARAEREAARPQRISGGGFSPIR